MHEAIRVLLPRSAAARTRSSGWNSANRRLPPCSTVTPSSRLVPCVSARLEVGTAFGVGQHEERLDEQLLLRRLVAGQFAYEAEVERVGVVDAASVGAMSAPRQYVPPSVHPVPLAPRDE